MRSAKRAVTVCVGLLLAAGTQIGHFAAAQQSEDLIHIVLAGDSTVTDHAGWGLGFAELLTDKAVCTNMAKGGRSSRSYRTEGWWQKCLALKPDYLLIQFGHNDQPGKGTERESEPDGAFRNHLNRYIDECHEADIKPILITSLTRRRWNDDHKIEQTLGEYAQATIMVARERKVPLIDLHASSIRQCEQLGPTAYRALEPMTANGADHTHLNQAGSRAVAPLIATELMQKVPEFVTLFSPEKIAAATIPRTYQKQLVSGDLHLAEVENTITLSSHGKTILVYNKVSPPVPTGMNPLYQRSGFLHPVMSPSGKTVTAAFPADHAHQQGIFCAWVKTTWNGREIDFWNLAKNSGTVLHQRVIGTSVTEQGLSFEVDLIHRATQSPIVDILRERWKITALPTDGSYHAFDLHTVQQAQTDQPLVVQQYHYGGAAIRGPMRWLTGKDVDKFLADGESTEPTEFLNDQGSDRVKGNHQHSKWVTMTGQIDGQSVTIAVLCHPNNFRAPQAARIHPTKPYFVFSPCVDGEFVIDHDHAYQARYRYLVTDAAPDAAWLNQQWQVLADSSN